MGIEDFRVDSVRASLWGPPLAILIVFMTILTLPHSEPQPLAQKKYKKERQMKEKKAPIAVALVTNAYNTSSRCATLFNPFLSLPFLC